MTKPTAITLIRNIADKGERLDIEPTMMNLTIKGERFWRDTSIQFTYPDGVRSVAYLAKVDNATFFAPILEKEEPC
jgi:hypothetical protein